MSLLNIVCKLIQFLPFAIIIVVDAVDLIFDTKYFYDMKEPGSASVDEFLRIPMEPFLMSFVSLISTIGNGKIKNQE